MMNKELLASRIRGQERSTAMWCGQFAKNRDISSRINAACAIGKLWGLLALLGTTEPESEFDLMGRTYAQLWDDVQQLS